MIAEISKSIAAGIVTAPPSKSMAHRMLICAGLAGGKSTVKNIALSSDVKATLDCLKALGADCKYTDNSVQITGFLREKGELTANCNESGSTLRFFIPIFWALGREITLTGREYLFTRPLEIYENFAKENGLTIKKNADSVYLSGKLCGGEYTLKGNVSSQFISGLLFALPLCKNDSFINIIPPIESRPYIDMTLSALETFGINARWVAETKILVKGSQNYIATDVTVEGDYSNAAFFAALNALGSDIDIVGLCENSLQGDEIVFQYLNKLKKGNAVIDVTNCPDIAPILITVAAALEGGKFTGTARLKLKESDRGAAIAQELAKFGADIKISENEIVVNKANLHKPADILEGHNDHRIVMSLAVLSTRFSGKIVGAEAVNKSFPDFFSVLNSLGIEVNLYDK